MRLLRRDSGGTLRFKDFPIRNDRPPYAILSHTWAENTDEEVSYNDILSGQGKSKPGYVKIEFCAEQSRRDSLEYFWVDTCCINQLDVPERGEAIRSMFRWYANASRCYVYLSDVSSHKRSQSGNQREAWDSFPQPPRWFRRGWTLQELLAPKRVEFFSRDCEWLGSKNTLAISIEKATGIPTDVLSGQKSIYDCSFQERFRWAAVRETRKSEDGAYCLLGLCNVSLIPAYGEEEEAFQRLREEIERKFKVNLDNVELLQRHSQAQNLCHNDQSLGGPKNSLRARVMELRRSLDFDQMNSRRATIKSAYLTTCAWLLQTPHYISWLDSTKFHEHAGFLWIKGKPGAGKSTLLKFAHEQAIKARSNDEIIISFFFNARGDLLEHSILGMYQSFLYQLLTEAESVVHEFDRYTSERLHAPGFRWSIELLSELLLSAVQRLESRCLKIFIDALDECDERDVQDMVHNLENLSVNCQGRVSICFASRHYPTVNLSDGLQMILERETGHGDDIRKYINKHLKQFDGRQKLQEIKAEVERKANGVFLWVFLVIDILNEKFNKGQTELVKDALREIPAKLSDLFNTIVRRDDVDKDSLLLCIQWILFAKRPLSHKEFFFAVKSGPVSQGGPLRAWDPEINSEDDMKRFVRDCSKGLAELTRSKISPTVQFIHESVKDFLITEKGLCTLWPDLTMDPESLSHHRLSECLKRYLVIKWPRTLLLAAAKIHPFAGTKLQTEYPLQLSEQQMRVSGTVNRHTRTKRERLSDEVKSKLPFLQYAAENILHHANVAARAVTRHGFIEHFDFDNWLFVKNLLGEYQIRFRYPTSLEIVLTEHECYRLLKEFFARKLSVDLALDVSIVSTALAQERWEFFRALLEGTGDTAVDDNVRRLQSDSAKRRHKGETLLEWAINMDNNRFAEILLKFTDAGSRVAMEFKTYDLAAERGDAAFLRALIVRCQVPKQFPGVLLRRSSRRGDLEVMQLAMDFDAQVNEEDDKGFTALMYALLGCKSDVVSFLISQGAKIESVEPFPKSLLQFTIENSCSQDCVALLLDHGADVRSRDRCGMTVLHHASMHGSLEITQLLLVRGAIINSQNSQGSTALHLASQRGHLHVVQVLLANGANVNLRELGGMTSLHWASHNNHPETIQLLVANGADIHSKNSDGLTALQLGRRRGHRLVVETLTACEFEIEGIVALETGS